LPVLIQFCTIYSMKIFYENRVKKSLKYICKLEIC
jgi:hypothetical protein